MEYSLQLFVNGNRISVIKLQDPEADIKFKISKLENPPNRKPCYSKASEISAFWLYVKDLQRFYILTEKRAQEEADKLWPTSPQREEYQQIASRLKDQVRSKGWAPHKDICSLSSETLDAMDELLGL